MILVMKETDENILFPYSNMLGFFFLFAEDGIAIRRFLLNCYSIKSYMGP